MWCVILRPISASVGGEPSIWRRFRCYQIGSICSLSAPFLGHDIGAMLDTAARCLSSASSVRNVDRFHGLSR